MKQNPFNFTNRPGKSYLLLRVGADQASLNEIGNVTGWVAYDAIGPGSTVARARIVYL